MDRLKSLLSHMNCFGSKKHSKPQPTTTKPLSTSSTEDHTHNPLTLIISHGAFQQQFHYQLYIDALNQHAQINRVLCPQQSSSGPSPPPNSFDSDIELLHSTVIDEIESGHDVLLLCHSYGGIPGCEALANLPISTSKGKILGIIFVSAFVADANQSLITSKMAGRASWVRIEGALSYVNNPGPTLFSLLDPTKAEPFVEKLIPQASSSFMSTTKHATWKHLPCYYIRCTEDQAMVPAEQDYFITRLKEGCEPGAKVRELRADHAPFASMPKELSRLTEGIIGELRAAS